MNQRIKLACMTWPYTKFPFERALEGIAHAGYRYVSFGLPHEGKPTFDDDAFGEAARITRLLVKYGLEPVTLISTDAFSLGQPIERVCRRLDFAKALGIEELLSLGTFGYNKFPSDSRSKEEMRSLNDAFAEQFRMIGAEAEKRGLVVTLKPHTGNTATASVLAHTIDSIGSLAVKASYDPGNVRFYEGIDPIRDFSIIAPNLISLVAKDHSGSRAENNFPVPGEGDVDFPALFTSMKSVGFNGTVIVERLDGTGGVFTAEDWDARIKNARITLEYMLLKAGFDV